MWHHNLQINEHNKNTINSNSKKTQFNNDDKSIDLRLYLNEVTDFDLIRELGQLFQAETHRLKKSFSNELVRHNSFRILKSW